MDVPRPLPLPSPERRPFQFSLAGMLIALTLAAVLLSCGLGFLRVYRFFQNPFAGFEGDVQFVDLTGPAAQQRMDFAWPAGVNPRDVISMSHKASWKRDAGSSWSQLRLTSVAAQAWADEIHLRLEQNAASSKNQVEGVRRTFSGIPPLHEPTGSIPFWWSPPTNNVRATEIMHWYDYGSGYANATYTSFHSETGTLWVYQYSCQHDKLWPQGKPPEGTGIAKESETSDEWKRSP
jgi:hypothetical protein